MRPEEIHRMTAKYRSTFSDIIVFDPDGVGDPHDPMQELHSERDLLSAATHLLYKPNEGSGQFLPNGQLILLCHKRAGIGVDEPALAYRC
jgi:hypothetical protein